jgi:quinol-cytochrome oxidoreductase complex cytochrome b subunit
MIAKHTKGYAVSESTNFWHTLRFALIYLLIIQIITSIFLSAFYVPLATHANYSIRFIEGEIQNR